MYLEVKDFHLILWHVDIQIEDLSVLELDFAVSDSGCMEGAGHLESGLSDPGIYAHFSSDFHCSAGTNASINVHGTWGQTNVTHIKFATDLLKLNTCEENNSRVQGGTIE